MCGIAGIYLKNKKAATRAGIEAFANRLLLEIEHRGKHATGFASIGWGGSAKLDKSDVPASEFIKQRESFQNDVQTVLLHTRYFTKGAPDVMGNNHPVSYGSCFTVHNGHIYNDDDLFKDEKLKRHFQVDSEIIPAVLDKYGLDHPDKIREALEKLSGAMAIAAVDPVKNPSRLLLARGKDSPLHIFENKNVIVWASEFKAIKDTWADLVGTPPQANKIKYIAEGKFYLVDDYKDLGEYEFKPKSRPVYPQTQHRQHFHRDRRNARVLNIRRPWDTQGPFVTKKDFDDTIAAYRQRDDVTLARRWDLRDTYDNHEDFKDVKGNLRWPSCICGSAILEEDMTTHLAYGPICKDCYFVIINHWRERDDAGVAPKAADDEDGPEAIVKAIDIPEMTPGDKRNLESWARIEAKLHRYTLQELSDVTGFSVAALDFLLFRTTTTAGDFGVKVLSTKFLLRKAYDKVNEFLHVNYGKEILDEVEHDKNLSVDAAQEIADQQFYPWTAFSEQIAGDPHKRIRYVCEAHGETFDYGEHCHSCVFSDSADDEDGWGMCDIVSEKDEEVGSDCGVEVIANEGLADDVLGKCPKCSSWIMGGVCIPCSSKDPTKRKQHPIEQPLECCCKTTRDRKCKRKLALIVDNLFIGKQLGYCTQHWNKCSAPKCAVQANFTGLDGQRYCHKDSRRKSGVADKAAKLDNSLTITEVK